MRLNINNLQYRKESCATLFLLLLIAAGAYLRFTGIQGYGWGIDDFDHFRLSYHENLTTLFQVSYTDAHPPLRNLILYFLKDISLDPFVTRMVSSIPGILLIPAFYLLLRKFFGSLFTAILGSFIITFAGLYIFSSQGTRPYQLTCLLLIWYFYAWNQLIQTQKYRYLCYYLLAGILVLSADYGAIVVCSAVIATGTMQLVTFNHRHLLRYWIGISLLHLIFFTVQILAIMQHAKNTLAHSHLNYIHLGSERIIKVTSEIFRSAALESAHFPHLMLFMFILGTALAFYRKDLRIIGLAIIPMMLMILLSALGLFPYKPGRHSLVFSFSNLLVILYAVYTICCFRKVYRSILLTLLSAALLFQLYTSPVSFSNPQNTVRSKNLFEVGLHVREYRELINFLRTESGNNQKYHYSDNYLLKKLNSVSNYAQLADLIFELSQPHSDQLIQSCRYHWGTVYNFMRCLDSLEALPRDNQKYVCLMCQFDPQSNQGVATQIIQGKIYEPDPYRKINNFIFQLKH